MLFSTTRMKTMFAMIMSAPGEKLQFREVPIPEPSPEQLLIKVQACGICRTDLHVIDGELKHPKLPLIPGHQIVGRIEKIGAKVKAGFVVGQRIGVPWLSGCCGRCRYCLGGCENLCDQAVFTGYQIDGGFAEYCVADNRFCFPIPKGYPDQQAAPLLCAGLIGYRALKKTNNAYHLGIYGFGAAAHIITQVACKQNRKVYAFTRPGDTKAQQFALQLGATWANDTQHSPPHPLDAAIIFAPVGELVPLALQHTLKGGVVVCAGIHMSDIPSFAYNLLWQERSICSVANLTRRDGEEFLELAPNVPVHTITHSYALNQANQALDDLRRGAFNGAAVIIP